MTPKHGATDLAAPGQTRMPAVFVGHGSPMNAVEQNRYTAAWQAFGRSIPKPKAILAISAHWYINATAALATPIPKTIHDFYGFPQALYDVEYPAPGDPALAATLKDVVAPIWVGLDRDSWGLDHGTWSVLVHMFPEADVPVIQLSIDATKPARYHLELGEKLGALRDQGVLIVGSGNIVHNLRMLDRRANGQAYDWATRFDADVKQYLQAGDERSIVEYARHPDGALAVPTPDHYLPLLYVAGLRRNDDDLGILVDGVDLGSISMTAVRVG